MKKFFNKIEEVVYTNIKTQGMLEIIITIKNSVMKIGRLSGAAARTGSLNEKKGKMRKVLRERKLENSKKNRRNRKQRQKYSLQRP